MNGTKAVAKTRSERNSGLCGSRAHDLCNLTSAAEGGYFVDRSKTASDKTHEYEYMKTIY